MGSKLEIDDQHLNEVCKPGSGAETCAFLTMTPSIGMTCAKGTAVEATIRQRLIDGQMKAQGDNCPGWQYASGERSLDDDLANLASGLAMTTEMPSRFWIVDPVGHRQHERSLPKVVPDWMRAIGVTEANVVRTVDYMDDDVWVCDEDDAQIEIHGPTGVDQFVPIWDSKALCHNCLFRRLAEEDNDAFIAMTFNGPLAFTDAMCGCPPCTARATRILAGGT